MSSEHDTPGEALRLSSTDIRILGSLIEKQATSPETYPPVSYTHLTLPTKRIV